MELYWPSNKSPTVRIAGARCTFCSELRRIIQWPSFPFSLTVGCSYRVENGQVTLGCTGGLDQLSRIEYIINGQNFTGK